MAKNAKWNDENVAVLVDGYDAEATDAARAEQVVALMEVLQKTKREVVGKLVHLKVYKPAEKVKAAKKDEGPTKKEILRDIEATGFNTDGFDGATKDALKRLQEAVA